MACNLVYVHLLQSTEHTEKCDLARGLCPDACSWAQFHAVLDAPLLKSDRRDAERREARRMALVRGEVPA